VKDILALVQSVATLTKDVERTSSEIKELRKDVNALTISVSALTMQIKHEQERTALMLDGHNKEITYMKEGNAAKFQVLTTILDQKIDGFESRLVTPKPKAPRRREIAITNSVKKSQTLK
jgi:hypothetical protein